MEVIRLGSAVRVNTPAKLNLFLEVLGKRPDGFHEIETLMIAVSICDTLLVSANVEGRIRLRCDWVAGMAGRHRHTLAETFGDLPPETENLVFRAVDRLRIRAGIESGVTLYLAKRIPSAAGMGGASSDAAAALVAAHELWQLRWPHAKLAELAAEIGSDVPFFLSSTGAGALTATCRGRGERVEPETAIPPLHFVIVKPPVGLSTADVYRQCTVATAPRSGNELRAALRLGDTARVARLLFNRLQETAAQMSPWINRLRNWMQQTDVLGHQMSGSGTSYFGICRNRRHAHQVAARLRALRLGEVFYATTRS